MFFLDCHGIRIHGMSGHCTFRTYLAVAVERIISYIILMVAEFPQHAVVGNSFWCTKMLTDRQHFKMTKSTVAQSSAVDCLSPRTLSTLDNNRSTKK